MADKRKTRLSLLVNPVAPGTVAFGARVQQCVAELRPVVDRLCARHGTTVLYAALISECGDATLAAAARGNLSNAELDKVVERVMRAIELAKRP